MGKLVRRLARRVRRMLRSRLVPAASAGPVAPRRRAKRPQLTVVVAVHNSGLYLEQCLRSLLGQPLRRLEVIAVDDGSTDGSAELLDRYAAAYERVKVIHTDQRGLAAARNLGAQRARGLYLTFVNPQDTVPRDAFTKLVRSLNASGSDFATGAVQRVKNGRSMRPLWVTTVHQIDRVATTVDAFPAALQDLSLNNRVYRKAFWLNQVGGFSEESEFTDVLATVTGYLRAASFDVLKSVTYRWHVRSDHASIVQERFDQKMLDDRLPILKEAWATISEQASDEVAGAYLGGVLDADLGTYLEHANTGDDAYRAVLQQAVRHFVALAGPAAWAHVRVDRRLRLWLALNGHWKVLEQCIEFFRLNGATPPTRVQDGRVLAVVPFLGELDAELPDVYRELSAAQTALSVCLERGYWDGSGSFVVEGWAFVRGIDLAGTHPELQAFLVEPVSGRRVALPLQPQPMPEATRWANQMNQSFENAGFRTVIDVSELEPVDPDEGARKWFLHVTNRTEGVERTAPMRSVIRSAISWRMRARELCTADDPIRFVPIMDSDLGFSLQVRPDRVRAVRLVSSPGGHVHGSLRIVNPIAVPVVAVRATAGGTVVEAPVVEQADGSKTFVLTLPVGAERLRRWTFRAVGEDGRRYRVSWPDEKTAGTRVLAAGDGPSATWVRSSRGFCDLATDLVSLQACEATVTQHRLSVEVDVVGLGLEDLRGATLSSSRVKVGVLDVRQVGERYRLEFPTRAGIWGTPDLPLLPGTYSIRLPERGVYCGITEDLLERCPVFGLTETHGFTVARTPGRDRLMLSLRAPLDDSERGRFPQNELTRWYDRTDFAPRDAVLFQCYRGEFSTDSQRALHEELWRRGTGLSLLWAVSSYSVPLPEGAVPLLIGSRDWYEAVGSARYLCQNIDYDRFFRKRDHQRYLQTFHGYPWKSMGVSLWRAQGKSESLIALECARRTSAWDSLVVPAPFCEELYRREYRYPHEVLVSGYPRDDVLVTADAAAVRAEVLERLGVDPGKKVVLYAPTWRDTVSTGAWTAQMFNELDLDLLTEQLGDDFCLLLRGHNYNLRGGSVGASASVLDVSSYPEVNDLILAADVAILDYSSMRFDWMLTGKPVLFFVPDLANYLSARTVLFEYAPTAPGPLLTTTEEVLQALRDLDDVAAEYAADRQAFNVEYQALHDGHATERVVDSFFGSDSWGDSSGGAGPAAAGGDTGGPAALEHGDGAPVL